MKRRVSSFIIALALCLNLFPVWVFAADAGAGDGLCPHHPEHTDACGYAAPVSEQECAHAHDDSCYTAQTNCVHQHTAQCDPDPDGAAGADGLALCAHVCTQDSGCVTLTLACPHEHDDACGYVPAAPGAPCGFDCRICPVEDLIGRLPRSVSAGDADQVRTQLDQIYALYGELSADEQRQVDLSPCAALLDQLDGMSSEVLDDSLPDMSTIDKIIFDADRSYSSPYLVEKPTMIDTKGHTLTGPNSSAIQIAETGELYFAGKAVSEKGAGVEVQTGGLLSITEQGTAIKGTTYALDVASGGRVQLSAGTYNGRIAAIRAEDGDLSALLAQGYSYFDPSGKPLSLAEAAAAKTVTVGLCVDHPNKSYAHTAGTTEHTWTCTVCKAEEPEMCTFPFDENGIGSCVCGNGIEIDVDEDDLADLVYDGTLKPGRVGLTITLTDGSNKVLVKDTDYKVDYQPRVDAGEITVTVTGLTFHGTFTKTYQVNQDRPALAWDTAAKPVPIVVAYDGEAVEASTPEQTNDLPPVKINILSTDDLQGYLQYSHRKLGETDYTDGLPINAGQYEVIVSLPEMQNFEAAVSDPIELTISKIAPIATPPMATTPTFNGKAQELVTPGTRKDVAVRDGVEIEFAENQAGPYSTAIPTGVNAGDYTVWYRTQESENYSATPATKVGGVLIQRKPLTPFVTLSDYTYLYDGGFKEPKVTVKDDDDATVLLDIEYQVTYQDNRDVGTAKAVVEDKPGGNYAIDRVEVEFQITQRTQETLSITQKPNSVTYGDVFTLGTSGGSGSGSVTWAITSGADVAKVDANSGQITVTGDGTATVKATKSGSVTRAGNYEDATDTWTFTAVKKPVTAIVTAEDKPYDGTTAASVHAVVEQGILPGDAVRIDGLTGTFGDADAGADKTVRVDITNAKISGNNSEHYKVSYSSTTVTATIHKAVAEIPAPPAAAVLTYDGTAQTLIAAGAGTAPAGLPVEYALSEDGPYSTDLPKGTAAGDYTVWYRIQETANYTGKAPASVTVTIAKKAVTPAIALSGDGLQTDSTTPYFYIYDGSAKEPAVTLTEADGTAIPAAEYTVAYRNNVEYGIATVTATAKADGNYAFTDVEETFQIQKRKAQLVTAPEAAGDPLTFNTRAQRLVTPGAGEGGTVVYSVDGGAYSELIPTGTKAKDYTVLYKVAGDDNHSDSDVGTVIVTIAPKPVTATIELLDENGDPLVNYVYDGSAKEPQVVVKDGSTEIAAKEYNVVYRDNVDAGEAKVNITDKPGGNYTVTGSDTFVIVKANIVFTQPPSAAAIIYDGAAHELLVPGVTSGGEVLYALGSATSTYTAAIPQATKAGNYTVYYKVVGDKNHNDFSIAQVPVTIQRKELTTIGIELIPDHFEYDGTVKLPQVVVKDGKTVLPEEEYTWTCTETASPKDQGTYTITIQDAPGGNYDLTGVTGNTATFTIGQTAQAELKIEGKPADTVYGDTFTLRTSGGTSSSAVTWSVTGGTAAAVDAATGQVTVTGVGQVTITATNPGGQNYLPVSDSWTFTAQPKPVTAEVTVAGKPYDGGTAATVTAVDIAAGGLVGTDAVTIDPASITAAFDTPNVGTGKTVTLDTSKVRVTGADAEKYDIRYPETASADITQATTSITAQPQKIDPLTYNREAQALVTAGETNVGFLVYSLDGTSFSPEIPTGTGAGTYTVHYKVEGTADYTGAAGGEIDVAIAPKRITPKIELSESSYVYDGSKKEPKITVKDGNTVIEEEQYTVAWAGTQGQTDAQMLIAADTYTATIETVTNGNYIFTATAKVVIAAATQDALKITGKPERVCYGDTIVTLDTTGGSGNGTVKWGLTAGGTSSTIDAATGRLTVKDTGSITVTAERTVPNYGTVSDTWTFTVEPKPVTAVVTVTGKTYDGTTAVAPGNITAVVKPGDLVDLADTITITGLTGSYQDAGAGTGKTVVLDSTGASTTADPAKYTVSYPATALADITPKQVTVTVALSGDGLHTDDSVTPPTYSYDYDGAEKTPNVTVTADDGAVLAAGDYDVSYADNRNVGQATVTVAAKAGGNYTFNAVEVEFAIRRAGAALTSTPQAKDLTYDGTAQDLVSVGTATGGTVVYSLKKDASYAPDDPDGYSEKIPQKTDAGTYIVYYKVRGDANHADTAPSPVSVTIKPKQIDPAITLTPDRPYVYDGAAHEPTVTVQDGAVTIDAAEYSVSYRDNVGAGTATVTVSNANGRNYTVNGTAVFQIAKAAPVFTAPQPIGGLQYTGAAQALVTAGGSNDGTVVYSVNGGNYSATVPTAVPRGAYTIQYKVVGDANHSDTAPATLTVVIGKNRVNDPTISLSSTRFVYNNSPQRPTVTVYDAGGRPIPEQEYAVAIAGTKGNDLVDVDTYTVTVTTPDSSNYDIQGDNTRTYEIVPADQENISITGTQALVRYGDDIQLGVTGGGAGGTITWTVEGKGGGTIDSTIGGTGLLAVRDVGPIMVTVKCSKGGNYSDVSAVWEFNAGKKPVTAVVTGVDRSYVENDRTAAVNAAVPQRELVSGDSITITGLTGTFDDDSVGTDKKVTVDSSSPSVSGTNAERYDITYPAGTTASILGVAATVDTEPAPVPSLTYDASQAQVLVTAGSATGGTMVYSLDGTSFAPGLPTAKNAGTYTVYFKAQGDRNHTDSEAKSVQVTIARQGVTPQIELSPPRAPYDGGVKRPDVTLRDNANNVIPAGEYKVTYVSDSGENWTDKGDYTVKIEDISGGNYSVSTSTAKFTIDATAQAPLEIVNKPGLVYYGDTFTLSAVGGSGGAKVQWSSSDENVAMIDANGLVTIKGPGAATITATKTGGGNYDTAAAAYPLNALRKPVTAIVTADDKVFNGKTNATIHITWEKGALVGTDQIDTSSLSGAFEDEHAGTNKTVTVAGTVVPDTTAQKYEITIPSTATASILKAEATAPSLTANDWVYDGTARDLVSGGDANTLYAESKDGVYSATVPTKTDAGTYTVWYKEKGDADHNDSAPQAIQVTVSRKPLTADDANVELSGGGVQKDTDKTYYCMYDGSEKEPSVIIKDGSATIAAGEYAVRYSGNRDVGTATITITSEPGGNYEVNGSVSFEIRQGGAVLTRSPEAKDLTYTGQDQELVSVGAATGGTVVYSLDKDASDDPDDPDGYSEKIPQKTAAGTYIVYYKVRGDANHADGTAVGSVTVTIKPKEIVSPKITVSGTYTYDGAPKEPSGSAVTVEDGATLIPSSEYALSYQNNIDAGTATVIVTNANGGDYIVSGTATFTIAKASIDAGNIIAPAGRENLPYNGAEQTLAQAGSAAEGTMVYSLDKGGPYSPAIPTGKDRGDYTVWYKVQGGGNYEDSTPASVAASIVPNAVTKPTIQVTPPSVAFNGEKQEPTVAVQDDSGLPIDGSEYKVTYTDGGGNPVTGPTNVGTYTLTITGTTGNYTFTANRTAPFEIVPAGQTPLIITGTRERVYYGDTIQLDTTGGNGTVTWSIDNNTLAGITADGLLTIKGVGQIVVTATSSASGYADQTATWRLHAEKKPVTAVVTAAAKPYDTTTAATVTAALQSGDLVGGDVVTIKLAGSFEDPNAGTDKKVIVDSTAPDFTGSKGHENYQIAYPRTTTASILKAQATDVKAPEAATGLTYTGDPQALVAEGSATGGVMEYSLDGKTYSPSLPTGTNAGSYEIWYRVKGDGNHEDTAGEKLAVPVEIAQQTVAETDLIVEFAPPGASYDGQVHRPSVTVMDGGGRTIPASEYSVDYGSTDWTSVRTHTVTITNKTGGNYVIPEKSADFEILVAGQDPLSIVGQPGAVRYGDTFTLSTSGGSGTGAVSWTSSDTTVAVIDQNGLVSVRTSGGPVTITATKAAGGGFGAMTATWTFSAGKRSVTPMVTADDKVFDGTMNADLRTAWKDGDLLPGDTIDLTFLSGTFSDPNVGANKTVRISGTAPANDKYAISIPAATTASITPKPATVTGVAPNPDLVYTGRPLELVTEGSANGGDVAYSRDGVSYTLEVPTGTNAGDYSVWYKALAGENHKDSAAVKVNVTIEPKPVTNPEIDLSSDSFDYDGTAKRPDVVVKDGNTVIAPSEYTVSYQNNTAVGTATVVITDADGGNYTVSGTESFTIKAGTAALKDLPQPRELTYTGSLQQLVTPGTAVNGSVVYALDDENGTYSASIPRGKDAGDYQVWYKVKGGNGADDTQPESVTVTIQPKQVDPTDLTVLLNNQYAYSTPYTGSAITPAPTVILGGQTLTVGSYQVGYSNNTSVGTATVTVQSTGRNYRFFKAVTFEITKGKAKFLAPPTARENLVYTGEAQELVEAGFATDGPMLYSTDGYTYFPSIPKAVERGKHYVMAKVQGNAMLEDSDPVILSVTIGTNVVASPTVVLSANQMTYTGKELKPTVTVADDNNKPIPAGEYTVTYSDNINVGTGKIQIASRGDNYSFTASATFEIVGADQPALTITGKQDAVYYGDTIQLGVSGPGTGTVAWASSDTDVAAIDQNGVVTVKKAGSATITATMAAGGGYKEAAGTWTFLAKAKPVKAVVSAADKPYDGGTEAQLTVAVSGLVGSDTFDVSAEGRFADAAVGTNKTVFIDRLTVADEVRAKYDISWPATTTASITQKTAQVTAEPKAKDGLKYTGDALELIVPGTAEGGNLAYSLDGGSYTFAVPKATDAGSYTVWYKVAASDGNYKDSAPEKVEATIGVNTDSPTVLCMPPTVQYDGTEKTPTVVVRDGSGGIIPESEYTVELPTPRIMVGDYTVTVTDKTGGNYDFTQAVTGTFKIVKSSQAPLSITDRPANVCYGDTFCLSAIGGSGSGAIVWSIDKTDIATIDANGVVSVKDTGGFTVTAYRKGADGYSDSMLDSVPFVAKVKPVSPVVTAKDKKYDGKPDATLTASWKSGDLVGDDELTLTVTGQFDSSDAGTNKRVDIVTHAATGANASKYAITWPDSTTASIYKVDAKLDTPPSDPGLTYDGSAQALVIGGTTVGGIGKIEYSLRQNGAYSQDIPTGTDAGPYTVWYRVADSVNYTGIAAASIEVRIGQRTPTISTAPTASGSAGQRLSEVGLSGGAVSVPGAFAWTDPTAIVVAGKAYEVTFTPADTVNYTTATCQVVALAGSASTPGGSSPSGGSSGGGAGTAGTSMQTTVQNGTASTVVSAADGSKLVKEAVESQSRTIVIKPEIPGTVTKTQVSIPASTVSQIQRETGAALTISTPIADATIPHEALDALGREGGTVSVAAEQTGQSVALTLTAGGKNVERVPGGLTLTVPAENAGPGTVAVLVREDGTRETIQKSVVENGAVSIPLDGPATVEIVDNSKAFADVAPTDWAADAVAFASARELFSGTSETTFSPEETMSRGMLATVLYRLEGQPDQALTMEDLGHGYSDVSSEEWYADGIAWAAENGIVNGYGDDRFGPNDSVTREQFVVMLWRYAGSPEAKSDRALAFTDADQASAYALEALRWAVENGVLNGHGNGRLAPGGTATRAEAAQMLKNFMENT